MSFFDRMSETPNVLTTRFGRFKIHLFLSDLILILKESIGLNLFTSFVFFLLLLLLVIVYFLVRLENPFDSCVAPFTSATSVETLEYHFRSIFVALMEVIFCRKMSSPSPSTSLHNTDCFCEMSLSNFFLL